MSPAPLTLRPARPADAAVAAPLIYAAGPKLFDLMFGPDPADVLRLFEALFPRTGHAFSYDRAVLAEWEGRAVGIALASPLAARRGSGGRLLWLLLRHRGFLALLRRGRDLRDIGACVGSPPASSYYLGILAVAAEYRCRGVGGALLEEVRRRALDHGASGVALHAEIDNVPALRVYARHGFRETERHPARPRLARLGVAGLATLVRALP